MQIIVGYPEYNIHSSFVDVDVDVELRESDGSAIVVTTVKIPLTSTSNQLFDKYSRGESLRIKLKNGDEWEVYFVTLDEGHYIFSSHL